MIKYIIKNTIINYKRSFKMKYYNIILEFDKLKVINHSLC